MQLVALDDLQGPGAGLGDNCGERRSLIGGIGEDALDEGKAAARAPIENESCAIAVLHVGRMDDGHEVPGGGGKEVVAHGRAGDDVAVGHDPHSRLRLGMTPDDVYQAYLKKNAVNHQRQDSGYVKKDEADSKHI